MKGHNKLNMAFVANLFNTFPCLPPVEDMEEDEDLEIYEETREEHSKSVKRAFYICFCQQTFK